MTFHIVPAATLDQDRREVAAEFARLALEAYYAALPPTLACTLIGDAFTIEGDEVADAMVALDDDGRPVGLVAGYALGDLALRQQIGLHHLLSNLPSDIVPDFVAASRALSGEVPAIDGDGYYLARIGIDPAARGSGLADQLMSRFLSDAGPRDAVLHVHGDNARAIAFYRRLGFVIENDSRAYWVMRRAAS